MRGSWERLRKADGEKLYALREANWLSQRKLAEIAGIAEKTVVDIELGHTKSPRMRTLLKLAHALGCYPDELLEGSPYNSSFTRVGSAHWDYPLREDLLSQGSQANGVSDAPPEAPEASSADGRVAELPHSLGLDSQNHAHTVQRLR
jgi:transcriptional regulator with XRE-family HTH domain